MGWSNVSLSQVFQHCSLGSAFSSLAFWVAASRRPWQATELVGGRRSAVRRYSTRHWWRHVGRCHGASSWNNLRSHIRHISSTRRTCSVSSFYVHSNCHVFPRVSCVSCICLFLCSALCCVSLIFHVLILTWLIGVYVFCWCWSWWHGDWEMLLTL